jgi:hypothetical protein
MRLSFLIILVLLQFTIVPFMSMVSNNKPAQFKVYGHTIVYKDMN